jgi:hypothetical protein
MSAWILVMLVGVAAIWIAIGSALVYLLALRTEAQETVSALGLEPQPALQHSGS